MNLNEAKDTLLEKKREIEERLQKTHKHLYEKDEAVSPDFHEQIVQTGSDDVVRALDAEGQQELRQINRALERIESGEYHVCSRCGAAIDEKRLAAIPYTEYCINCA